MTELSYSCLVEDNGPWKRIKRHNGQHTVVVATKALTQRLLSEVHGNALYGHEGNTEQKKN
jgi:hypothetical protein